MGARQTKEFGYIRVSAKDQHEDRQMIAMTEQGIRQENIFMDKQSGKDFNRPQYRKMMRRLKPGDTVIVMSIDRLGRNYDEIQNQWRIITREKQADIVVLDMPLLDTRQKGQDLTGTFVADLVLQILSYVAQVERENIRKRQAEGIAAALARGVRFGRERKPVPAEFYPLQASYRAGKVSARGAARTLGVSHSTFLKWDGGFNQAGSGSVKTVDFPGQKK